MENQPIQQQAPHIETQAVVYGKNPNKWLFIYFPIFLAVVIIGIVVYFVYTNYQKEQQISQREVVNTSTKQSLPSSTSATSRLAPMQELTVEAARDLSAPIRIAIGGGGPIVVEPNVNNKIPITLSNTGNEQVTIELQVSGDPMTWFNIQQSPKSKRLNPGEEYTFNIQLTIPQQVKTGDRQVITIQAIPQENPRMSDSTQIEVKIGPEAWFEYEKITNSKKPYEVKLSNLTIGQANSWNWDFGDGLTSNEKSPASHSYQKAGQYTITLTAQSSYGLSTYSRQVYFP